MIWYHGEKKTRSYFEGWYLKCQAKDGRCLALIPAIHVDGYGRKTALILVALFSWGFLSCAEGSVHVQIGSNVFSKHGMELAILLKVLLDRTTDRAGFEFPK